VKFDGFDFRTVFNRAKGRSTITGLIINQPTLVLCELNLLSNFGFWSWVFEIKAKPNAPSPKPKGKDIWSINL